MEMTPDEFDRLRDETRLTDEAVHAAREYGLDEYDIAALQDFEIVSSDPPNGGYVKIFIQHGRFKVERYRDLKAANKTIGGLHGFDAADVWLLRCARNG